MSDQESKHAVGFFVGGVLAGVGFSAWLTSVRKQSRAEKEFPELTRQIAEEVDELLSDLELHGELDTEADFHDALVTYFEKESNCEIESKPRTDHGEPDIVLNNVVALEIKVNPRKGERDRCVGQVSAFAREWLTMIVLFDTPPTRVQALRRSLDHVGLEDIPVVDFGTD